MTFLLRGFAVLALMVAFPLSHSRAAEPPVNTAKSTRPFRMGFTGFVPALTADAFTSTRDFCRKHGDLIAHHIEGAAWTEMHVGEALPADLLKKWKVHRERTPENGKVYLALSPGRDDLKVAEKCAPLSETACLQFNCSTRRHLVTVPMRPIVALRHP